MPEEQKVTNILSDNRGVRLDIYVNDDKGTVYNIEMQKRMKKGKQEEKIENAKDILDLADNETIAKRLGLKVEFVKNLREEAGIQFRN